MLIVSPDASARDLKKSHTLADLDTVGRNKDCEKRILFCLQAGMLSCCEVSPFLFLIDQ